MCDISAGTQDNPFGLVDHTIGCVGGERYYDALLGLGDCRGEGDEEEEGREEGAEVLHLRSVWWRSVRVEYLVVAVRRECYGSF